MIRTERARSGLRRWIGFALGAVMAFGAMAGGAAAHISDEHGEITLHDTEDGPATNQIECEFWVQGHNVTHQEGEIRLFHRHTDFSSTPTLGHFEGEPNASGGWDFEVGPFAYEHGWGNHDIEVYGNESDESGSHFLNRVEMNYASCEKEPEKEAQPPTCPENLTASAQNDESVALAWGASADADSYHVYRATGDGAFEQVATVDETSFTDQGTEADVTYRYEVTAANEAGEAEDCPTVEVTAIPFFGSPAIVAMAAIGSVGAVAAVRTRRA